MEIAMIGYSVEKIEYAQTKPFILDIHYAHRMPSISYAFGLFYENNLVGIVSYGMPASPWLCKGICGEDYKNKVIELNRLVLLNNKPNEASYLVGQSLRMLPSPKIIVSYADTQHNHVGIVYQASNFYFTGTTKPRTDMASKDGKHSRHHLGDRTTRVNRSAKHRYVIFIGDKRQKRQMMQSLRYQIQDYPKKEI